MLKNKKRLIIVSSCIVAFIGVLLVLWFQFKPDNQNTKLNKEKITKTHEMYVSINPLVKLLFTETYMECEDDYGKKTVCSYIDTEVINYELINEDSKEIYKDLDFKGKDVNEVVVMLCDTARENNIGFKSMEITTDSENIKQETIMAYLKENSEYETEYTLYVNLEEYINEEDLLNKDTFTISFDSNGGSKVTKQIIDNGKLVEKPENPTRDGYEFIEWQLNGEKYDFKTPIYNNFILKAKWRKIVVETPSEDEKDETKPVDKEESKPEVEPEEPSTVQENIKTIQTKYELEYLEINSKPKGYSYKVLSDQVDKVINVTISGEESLFTKYTEEELSYYGLYLDLEGLSKGNHDVKIKIYNDVPGFTYTITPQTLPVKIYNNTYTSTVDKINLNDNILVNDYYRGTMCGTILFATNAEEVYGKYAKDNFIDGWTMNEDGYVPNGTLTYDAAKEQAAISKLEIAKNNRGFGHTEVHYSFADNAFRYSIYYLVLSPNSDAPYTSFGKEWQAKIDAYYNSYLKGIFDDAYVYSSGGCGYMPEDQLLTEEMCATYNLNCARW